MSASRQPDFEQRLISAESLPLLGKRILFTTPRDYAATVGRLLIKRGAAVIWMPTCKTCEQNGLLKDSVSRLSHAVIQFRNLVHLSAEKTKKHTISKATAVGAVSSIFTIANDF